MVMFMKDSGMVKVVLAGLLALIMIVPVGTVFAANEARIADVLNVTVSDVTDTGFTLNWDNTPVLDAPNDFYYYEIVWADEPITDLNDTWNYNTYEEYEISTSSYTIDYLSGMYLWYWAVLVHDVNYTRSMGVVSEEPVILQGYEKPDVSIDAPAEANSGEMLKITITVSNGSGPMEGVSVGTSSDFPFYDDFKNTDENGIANLTIRVDIVDIETVVNITIEVSSYMHAMVNYEETLSITVHPMSGSTNITNIVVDADTGYAMITFETNHLCNYTLVIGVTTDYEMPEVSDTWQMVTEHEAHIYNLEANTLYHFKITVTNMAGESVDSGDLTFRTKVNWYTDDHTTPLELYITQPSNWNVLYKPGDKANFTVWVFKNETPIDPTTITAHVRMENDTALEITLVALTRAPGVYRGEFTVTPHHISEGYTYILVEAREGGDRAISSDYLSIPSGSSGGEESDYVYVDIMVPNWYMIRPGQVANVEVRTMQNDEKFDPADGELSVWAEYEYYDMTQQAVTRGDTRDMENITMTHNATGIYRGEMTLPNIKTDYEIRFIAKYEKTETDSIADGATRGEYAYDQYDMEINVLEIWYNLISANGTNAVIDLYVADLAGNPVSGALVNAFVDFDPWDDLPQSGYLREESFNGTTDSQGKVRVELSTEYDYSYFEFGGWVDTGSLVQFFFGEIDLDTGEDVWPPEFNYGFRVVTQDQNLGWEDIQPTAEGNFEMGFLALKGAEETRAGQALPWAGKPVIWHAEFDWYDMWEYSGPRFIAWGMATTDAEGKFQVIVPLPSSFEEGEYGHLTIHFRTPFMPRDEWEGPSSDGMYYAGNSQSFYIRWEEDSEDKMNVGWYVRDSVSIDVNQFAAGQPLDVVVHYSGPIPDPVVLLFWMHEDPLDMYTRASYNSFTPDDTWGELVFRDFFLMTPQQDGTYVPNPYTVPSFMAGYPGQHYLIAEVFSNSDIRNGLHGGFAFMLAEINWVVMDLGGSISGGGQPEQTWDINDTTDNDHDDLPDNWEMANLGTVFYGGSDDPDEDGYTNVQEMENGTDPNDPEDHPVSDDTVEGDDTDGDGLPDSWEIEKFGDLDETADADTDGDGYNNTLERKFDTDPNNADDPPADADMDKDTLSDSWELTHFGSLDQTAEDDPDGDGLSNSEEEGGGTDPNIADVSGEDSDGDGISDDLEKNLYMTDPNDPDSYPGSEGDVEFTTADMEGDTEMSVAVKGKDGKKPTLTVKELSSDEAPEVSGNRKSMGVFFSIDADIDVECVMIDLSLDASAVEKIGEENMNSLLLFFYDEDAGDWVVIDEVSVKKVDGVYHVWASLDHLTVFAPMIELEVGPGDDTEGEAEAEAESEGEGEGEGEEETGSGSSMGTMAIAVVAIIVIVMLLVLSMMMRKKPSSPATAESPVTTEEELPPPPEDDGKPQGDEPVADESEEDDLPDDMDDEIPDEGDAPDDVEDDVVDDEEVETPDDMDDDLPGEGDAPDDAPVDDVESLDQDEAEDEKGIEESDDDPEFIIEG